MLTLGLVENFPAESTSSLWLNQPIPKICSSNWIISLGRGENKKHLKPPPSYDNEALYSEIF